MKREEMCARIENHPQPWDFIVIGGGATGIGTAIDAASRGYEVLLLEQSDFAQGTSSRSTKLIHGGVRYLQQGNLSLVLEALEERGLLLENAPHLVRNLEFIVPNYDWWQGPFYGVGLKLYDVLAGKKGFGASRFLSKEETLARIPTIETRDLRGGIVYHDGQFDDSRLVIDMAKTAVEQGATVLNYCPVISLLKGQDHVCGVVAKDSFSGRELELKAKTVINATGVFCDAIRRMDDRKTAAIIQPSQGIHIVLDQSFLPGESAIMVPHTADGRVLFAIPWHDRVVVGTTDTPVKKPTLNPLPKKEELKFVLFHAAKYLSKDPTPKDVLSTFAGLRPLVKAGETANTAALSRDHSLTVSPSGLMTITGGKWTTYRKMGQDIVDKAITMAGLDDRPSRTEHLNLFGWSADSEGNEPFSVYGSSARDLKQMIRMDPELDRFIHPDLPYRMVEVVWSIRNEMARTLEDVMTRRTRALILNARASMAAAPQIAAVMARELGRDEKWRKQQIDGFLALAESYLPESYQTG